MLKCILVARKENLTGFSTDLTSRSKNLDPTGNPDQPVDPTGAGRPDRFPSLPHLTFLYTWAKSFTKFITKMQGFKRVLDLNCK